MAEDNLEVAARLTLFVREVVRMATNQERKANDVRHSGYAGGHHRVHAVMLAGCVLIGVACGCAARSLKITIPDEYINTKMHDNRACEDRTGERLELDIVCVLPSDLEIPINRPLRPDGNITSKVWFEMRPVMGKTQGVDCFDLPPKQIYRLTDKKSAYGTIKWSRLTGSKHGNQVVKIKGIKFPKSGKLHSHNSVIYIFPKFIDADGQVLETRPVMFNSPGDYRKELSIEIGVEDPCGESTQYIRNTTEKKFGASR